MKPYRPPDGVSSQQNMIPAASQWPWASVEADDVAGGDQLTDDGSRRADLPASNEADYVIWGRGEEVTGVLVTVGGAASGRDVSWCKEDSNTNLIPIGVIVRA